LTAATISWMACTLMPLITGAVLVVISNLLQVGDVIVKEAGDAAI
jgi:hypothetical protein